MSMKFETNDRPSNDIINALSNDNTPLSKIPFPTNVEEPYNNFLESLSSESYKNAIENFRKYTNVQHNLHGSNNIQFIMMLLMQSVSKITQLEQNHHRELENLAVELIMKEMSIPEGSLKFDVKIVTDGNIDSSDFNHSENQVNKPSVEIDDENFIIDEDLEKTKRRLINSIIQGSSKRGHYMYHLVEDKLNEIINNESIIPVYGVMMSINDILYWQLDDDIMKSLSGGNGGDPSIAGKEQIDRNTEPPTIYARGVNFPVLVHEIIKGIMELFAIQGLPENYEEFEKEEDTIENENWDLRVGPSIWSKLRSQFPIEIIIDNEKIEQQNYLLVEIFKLPAKEFLYFMREIMKESDEGKRMMNELMNKIVNSFNDDEYENTDE